MKNLRVAKKVELLKLDFGCGKNVREGFDGVDRINFEQKHVLNLSEKIDKNFHLCNWNGEPVDGIFKAWPFKDNSVEEGHASHFVEHLKEPERIHFVNELYRVLIPNGKCLVITPNWSSCRAYGDLTHKWPPVSEFWFNYLNKKWRDDNAPHNDFYKCDFDHVGGYNMHPGIINRNQEYQIHALTFWKEAGLDILTTLTKAERGE